MKFVLAIAMFGVTSAALAQPAVKPVPPAFDAMKSLAGDWTAVLDGKQTLSGTVRLLSNGTAVEESFTNDAQHMQMVSVYTPDGDKLAMTHFCDAGNQPRMETPALKHGDNEFAFHMTGVGNLTSAKEGHMVALTLRVEDRDHYSEVWTWSEAGKTATSVFHFTRKA
jgi:hypothetical protein